MSKIKHPHNGLVVIRIGRNTFNFPTDGTGKSVSAKMLTQMRKIKQSGGSFDYCVGYPKDGDAILAVRKGMRPEQFPELMEQA
jgi:hypothetical protein